MSDYKAAAERTDADERALVPAFKRTNRIDLLDQKRVDIQRNRIDACDTLLDYLHDDVPHRDQQPLMDLLRTLKGNLEDEMEDALTT